MWSPGYLVIYLMIVVSLTGAGAYLETHRQPPVDLMAPNSRVYAALPNVASMEHAP